MVSPIPDEQPKIKTSGRAIASLICGVIAVVPYIGFYAGVLAVVLGYIGLLETAIIIALIMKCELLHQGGCLP